MVQWHSFNAEEYPPSESMLHWATDGETVFKAIWHWNGPHEPLREGAWSNEAGEPVKVITWAFLEDSPSEPPPLPQPYDRPLSDPDDPTTAADWWKE